MTIDLLLLNTLQTRVTHIRQAFIDFRTRTIKESGWGNPAGEMPWQMEDGYMLWYNGVSHHHILPLIPGSPLTPANEEKIIPH